MAPRTKTPIAAPADLDPIAALHDAIIEAAEQTWRAHDVSADEQARLRPGVLAIAEEATSRLRAEHTGRQR